METYKISDNGTIWIVRTLEDQTSSIEQIVPWSNDYAYWYNLAKNQVTNQDA